MTAYLIIELDIQKPDLLVEYRQQAGAVLESFGGRYLVRAGEYQSVEGDWKPSRLSVVAFPSYDAAIGFYTSDAYKPLLTQRLAAALSKAVIIKGVDE